MAVIKKVMINLLFKIAFPSSHASMFWIPAPLRVYLPLANGNIFPGNGNNSLDGIVAGN